MDATINRSARDREGTIDPVAVIGGADPLDPAAVGGGTDAEPEGAGAVEPQPVAGSVEESVEGGVEGGVAKAQRIVPVPTLAFRDPALAGLRIRLDRDDATLGRREDNGYVLPDPRVSRVHASIRKEAGTLLLTDLGSAGGTSVGGQVITGPTVIRHGDQIAFGPVVAMLEDPAAETDETTVVMMAQMVDTGPHLSPRQQQVLELIAQGMTNAEVGAELGITERTVKAYAQELYDKLGVRNRAGAVAQGAKLRLI